jgi:purine nucleoside phosphorylase
MARSLGADLVSMSTALEAIAARYLRLRVAAIACVANRGAGMQAGEGLSHDGVLSVVERSVASSAEFLERGCSVMIRS